MADTDRQFPWQPETAMFWPQTLHTKGGGAGNTGEAPFCLYKFQQALEQAFYETSSGYHHTNALAKMGSTEQHSK